MLNALPATKLTHWGQRVSLDRKAMNDARLAPLVYSILRGKLDR
jgi:hypothetical protein